MRKKKFVPKESVKLPREVINAVWDQAKVWSEEKERLKLLEELYKDPVGFLNNYFTDEQVKIIKNELIDDWNEDRCC